MPVGLNVPPLKRGVIGAVTSSLPSGSASRTMRSRATGRKRQTRRVSWTTILDLPTALQLLRERADRFATSLFLKPPYVAW